MMTQSESGCTSSCLSNFSLCTVAQEMKESVIPRTLDQAGVLLRHGLHLVPCTKKTVHKLKIGQ